MLYTDDAVFMFHSRSKDAAPGHGVGESIRVPAEQFQELATITDWRKLLSNFAESPFVLDELTWLSVEHVFQASKFRTIAPAYYRSFAVESGSERGRTLGGQIKSAGGRKGLPLGPEDLERWDREKRDVMRRALTAKYAQHEPSRRVLRATQMAKLTHRPLRASYTSVEIELMEVRNDLR